MASAPPTSRGIWSAVLTGACLIAFGSGCQAAFAPTVVLSCPARTAVAPDCDLRWLVAFDGPVRAIMWGDHMSLQTDLRDPLRSYFADAHAPAIQLTMRPSWWTDPGGTADNRLVRRSHPMRLVADAIIGLGLMFWILLPARMVMSVARRNRR